MTENVKKIIKMMKNEGKSGVGKWIEAFSYVTHNTLLIINVLELSKHSRTEVEVPCLLLRDHRSKMSRNLEEVELELADIQPEPIRRRICMPLKIKQAFCPAIKNGSIKKLADCHHEHRRIFHKPMNKKFYHRLKAIGTLIFFLVLSTGSRK